MVLDLTDGRRTSVSYPKWLFEHHLGRRLANDETIDHVDRDFTNDDLTNLVVKKRAIHGYVDALRVRPVEITCVLCGTTAKKDARTLEHNAKLGKAGPFCGRSCAGKYGKSVQLDTSVKLPRQQQRSYDREYYKITK